MTDGMGTQIGTTGTDRLARKGIVQISYILTQNPHGKLTLNFEAMLPRGEGRSAKHRPEARWTLNECIKICIGVSIALGIGIG